MAASTSLTTTTPLILPQLTVGQQIVDKNGLAMPGLVQSINNGFASITTAFANFATQLAINTAQEATNGAQTATNTAQLATNTALLNQIVAAVSQLQTLAGQVTTLQSTTAALTTTTATLSTAQTASTITSSYTVPADVLSGSSDATASTIVIANHSRVYTDGTTVAVTGATLTGLLQSTTYFVFYSDPTRAGGTVAYQTSMTADSSAQINGVCSVGSITTPAPPATGSTAPTTSTGSGTSAPGVPSESRGSGNTNTEQP